VIGTVGRVLGILALAAILLMVVTWVALGIDLSVELWSDQCVFDDTRCDYGADYDLLGVIQLLVLLGGAALAGVCCVRGIRRLSSGRPADRLLRRSLQALAILAFWFLGPFTLLVISQQ
jgi:hypothetical protein